MKNKLLAGIIGAFIFIATTAITAAEIPAGYALVPISALTATQTTATPAQTTEISAETSSLRSSEELGFVGQELILIATLRDSTGQPLANHKVNLISSRADDKIQTIHQSTDTNGEIIFSATAGREGVSSFTAIDQTSGNAITERPRIVFLKNTNGIGGNLLQSDIADADLTFDADSSSFSFDKKIEVDFPNSGLVDTPSDISVGISDADGNVVESFTGTISFKSSDVEAILPRDYTFKELDRGIHTFANAITFTTAGTKTIQVTTDDNLTEPLDFKIKIVGEYADTDAPTVESPSDDFLTNEIVSLIGVAAPNSDLAVFVDGQLFDEGESNSNGDFLIDLDLPDGKQEISVAVLNPDNSVGPISEPITVVIDTIPPELKSISLDPGKKVEIGTNVKVTVKSEPSLFGTTLVIGENSVALFEEADGIYVAQIQTTSANTHALGVELTDEAGNKTNANSAATLTVEEPTPKLTIAEAITTPKNKRVDLSWDPPLNHAEINHYDIFYGFSKENLDKKFETSDSRTAWYIGSLNNNTTYYFQIISVGNNDKVNGFSNIVSATPTSLLQLHATGCGEKIRINWLKQPNENIAGYRVEYGVASTNYIEKRMLPGGRDRTEWELRDLINGTKYFITVRGLDASGNVIFSPDEEVSATPIAGACHEAPSEQPIQLWQREDENGNTILVWSAVSNADGYRVYAGTEPNYFDLPTITVTTPYFRPEGLMANENYYFAVRAVSSSGQEAATFSNIAKIEVGPFAIVFASLIAAFGGSWFLRKRTKLFSK